jgi:hypothetical protein
MHQQYCVIPGIELRSRGVSEVLREIRDRMAGRPVHLCLEWISLTPPARLAYARRPGAVSRPVTGWR